jgi:UDP-N-acetylmuramate dehydrogenase
MADIQTDLEKIINKNNIFKNESMSKHTSFKVGGNADFFVKIEDVEELKSLLKYVKENNIPLTILGNGTNVLVKDGGIRGIVCNIELSNYSIDRKEDGVYITVQSGVALPRLANIALNESLTGLEYLSGIPGTVGGAIYMNAGAFGNEMKDVVVSSKYMDRDGNIYEIGLEDHKFEYRKSVFSGTDNIILETTIKLQPGNQEDIKSKMKENLDKRVEKQPLEYPSAGSTFKRKEDIIVSKVIDECGLKGYQVGGAAISKKHAGFIINVGGATASDILAVVEHTKEVVKEKCDIDIDLEMIVLGED